MGNLNCKSSCQSSMSATVQSKGYKKGKDFKSKLEPIKEAVREIGVGFKETVDVLEISKHDSEKGKRWYSDTEIDHMMYGAKQEARRKYHEETGPIFDNPPKQRKLKKYSKIKHGSR